MARSGRIGRQCPCDRTGPATGRSLQNVSRDGPVGLLEGDANRLAKPHRMPVELRGMVAPASRRVQHLAIKRRRHRLRDRGALDDAINPDDDFDDAAFGIGRPSAPNAGCPGAG